MNIHELVTGEMTTNRRCLCAATLLWAACLILCCAGCQHIQGMLGMNTSKVAAARQATPLGTPQWSDKVTKEQEADVQMALARSLEQKGQTDRAIKGYEQVVARDKSRADAYHRLAVLYDKKGDDDTATKHYQNALKRDPNNPDLHADYGYRCYLHESWDEAEKQLRRALELSPESARVHNNLGLLLARTGRPDEAYQEFLKARCTEAQAHANLAFALTLNKDFQQAKQQFDIALQLDPQLPTARNGLRLLEAQNRMETSLAQGDLAATMQPTLSRPEADASSTKSPTAF